MELIIFILVIVILNLLSYVFIYRIKKGKYKKVSDTDEKLLFATNLGTFRIDKRLKVLGVVTHNKKAQTIEASNIKGFRYSFDEKTDFFYEYFFRGFDVWDILPAYRDRFHWYSLIMVLSDESEIPIFVTGQYQPREPIMVFVHFEQWLIRLFGLYKEIDPYSRNMLDSILNDFKQNGLPSNLL